MWSLIILMTLEFMGSLRAHIDRKSNAKLGHEYHKIFKVEISIMLSDVIKDYQFWLFIIFLLVFWFF